jgi:hypothetical protein
MCCDFRCLQERPVAAAGPMSGILAGIKVFFFHPSLTLFLSFVVTDSSFLLLMPSLLMYVCTIVIHVLFGIRFRTFRFLSVVLLEGWGQSQEGRCHGCRRRAGSAKEMSPLQQKKRKDESVTTEKEER